jgi:hypothetical protein
MDHNTQLVLASMYLFFSFPHLHETPWLLLTKRHIYFEKKLNYLTNIELDNEHELDDFIV